MKSLNSTVGFILKFLKVHTFVYSLGSILFSTP